MNPYEALLEYDAEYRREQLELAQIRDQIKGKIHDFFVRFGQLGTG